MSTTEEKVISAVCKNKDIHSVIGEDNEIFGPYADVMNSVREYYFKFKTVPEFSLLQERFDGLEPVDTTAPTKFYVEELRNEFLGARMETIMKKAAEASRNDSPVRVLEKLNTSLSKLMKYTTAARDVDITDIDQAVEYFEKLKGISDSNEGTPGIPTNFKSIDSAYTTGMGPGHSIVCMGYTGRGKSMVAALLAVQAWLQGYKVMMVSLEMSPEEQMERVYAIMASGIFKISDLSRGDVSPDEFRTWAKKKFAESNSFIVTSQEGIREMTPNVVQAKIDTHKPDFVILDYLQLMQDNAKTQGMTPRMLNLSREIKLMAMSNAIPIMSLTAVTDEDGDKRDQPPMLSQISWSSGIEYDANMAFAVHRHDDTDIVEIVCRKNRHGPMFNFYFDVDFDRGVWTEKFSLD